MTFEYEVSTHQDIRLEQNVAAAYLTSFRIGGNVAYVVYPQSLDALCAAVQLSKVYGLPYQIVGNGSNILADDEPYYGVWIVTRECTSTAFNGVYVDVASGVSLCRLIENAADRGLSGLENLYGIPGTVGGAICMNAGAFGTQIADTVVSVTVYDQVEDKVLRLGYDACGFQYRESVFLSGRYVILDTTLRLCVSRTDLVKCQMEYVRGKREASQPLEFPSAGSTFKRPAGAFAGRVITECGLRGMSIGGAIVSEKHAGFIVNTGGATARDVKDLIEHISATVYEKAGVRLEPEIIIL